MQTATQLPDPSFFELATDRLRLRLPRARDAEAIARYYRENQEHLQPTEPQRPPLFYTPAFWRERIGLTLREFTDDRSVRLLVENSDAGFGLIGAVNFTDIQRGPLQACNLGYSLAATAQGRGFMSEALLPAIEFMFVVRNLHRINAGHLPENLRSAAVLRRAGFQPYGYARDYLLIAGQWRDHVLHGLNNPNWQRP